MAVSVLKSHVFTNKRRMDIRSGGDSEGRNLSLSKRVVNVACCYTEEHLSRNGKKGNVREREGAPAPGG
jgi:hypothetical protein